MIRINKMKQSRQENIIYLIVWSMLFAAPLLSLYVRSVSDPGVTFEWTKAFVVWPKFAIYLALFLVHNFLLAPLLIHGHRRIAYFSIVAVVIAAFTLYQCSSRPPVEKPMGEKPHTERGERRRDGTSEMMPRPPHDKRLMPPPFIGERDIMAIVVLILILGANLGIKYYFKTRDDRKRLAELERENLEQQLEYLRYQINPHFFMNTLNNIHALVDIDPEQAKDSIVDMSRMMRYLLYESDKQYVSLNNAVIFLKKYLNLMKLRYTDQVNVNVDVPENCSEDIALAPLVFIPFVENAFKHGVAYDKPSTIDIDIEKKNGRLLFHCHNTKSHAKHEYGGVGLSNVTKRLELIYGNDYSLNIDNGEETYDVLLDLPARRPEDFAAHAATASGNHPDN